MLPSWEERGSSSSEGSYRRAISGGLQAGICWVEGLCRDVCEEARDTDGWQLSAREKHLRGAGEMELGIACDAGIGEG